jgi:cysteine desulfurase
MSHVKHFDETDKHINTVVNYLIKELEVIENVEFNVKNKSSIININVDINLMSESMITYFYDNNVALSSKSACSSRTNNPSVTLKSLEINKEKISKSLRISLAKYNTCEEVDYFISVLKEMIKEYK